jgi:hypothetical protein
MSKKDLYLLHAVWKDERNNYSHRVIHSTGTPEELCDSFFREQKEWVDCPAVELGWLNKISLVRVTLFKTVSMDNESWKKYLKKAKQKREDHIESEERRRDFETIRTLVKKHGTCAMEVLALAAEENDA